MQKKIHLQQCCKYKIKCWKNDKRKILILTHLPFSARHNGKTHKANAVTLFCQRAFQPFPLCRETKTMQYNKNKLTEE
jgi:hypothetical protein